jgi:hypothetical protein
LLIPSMYVPFCFKRAANIDTSLFPASNFPKKMLNFEC